VLLLAGPTASGKSALALHLARALGGVVINADSMQLYRELSVLTARPSAQEMTEVPHRLYGVCSGVEPASAGVWERLVGAEIEQCRKERQVPIVTGGTGLYLNILRHGLSPIPEINAEVRLEARQLADTLSASELHARLMQEDPLTASRLRPSDTQRLVRAWEVWRQTGRPLAEWQALPRNPLVEGVRFLPLAVTLPREVLYARCDARFLTMMKQGAVEEVQALLALHLPADAPVMKAVGVPEIASLLAGTLRCDEAIARAQQMTRNYAKRQVTWLRHQFSDAEALEGLRFTQADYLQSVTEKLRGWIDRKED
jgi:tRNA dimethylallyltransferase